MQREKAVSAAGKNASKKCRFPAVKIQSSRKNTLQQHKSTFAAENMHFGGSGKKPSEAGKNPSEARKKPAEAGKKPAAEKVQLCNPKSCRNGKNTFPQREKAAALKVVVKEEALPLREQPEFPALAELAKRGLLAPDTWNCKRAQISLKATINVPMLGTIIEQNGDGLLEQSHMPVGWPLHIDGAVRQSCAHRDTTLQELDDLLGEYDLKRDLVEINRKAPQWSHNAVWNKKYMEPKPGFTLKRLWADSESAIAQKTSPSYEVQDNDIRRAVMAISAVPAATLPDSAFLLALGTPALLTVPPETGSPAQRAIEEWERNLCENKAVAILEQMQAGRPAVIKKDGGEMLIALVLDRPLAEAKALVDAPDAFIQAITRIMQDKKNHPVIAQMIQRDTSDDLAPAEGTASSSRSYSHRAAKARPPTDSHIRFQ